MAFHYQNLLLEQDLNYEEFNQKYEEIKDFVQQKIINTGLSVKYSKKQLGEQANNYIKSNNYRISREKSYTFDRRVEKVLLKANIIFNNDEKFIEILRKYNITNEQCYLLKDAFSTLDRKDKDYNDSTMDALANYYIPQFQLLKQQYGLTGNDEMIIIKLLEIIYIHPELLEKTNKLK